MNAFRITRLALAGALVALVAVLIVQSGREVPEAKANVGGGSGGDLMMIPCGMSSGLEIVYVIDTSKKYMATYVPSLAGLEWVSGRRIDYDFQFPLAGHNDLSKLKASDVKKQVEEASAARDKDKDK